MPRNSYNEADLGFGRRAPPSHDPHAAAAGVGAQQPNDDAAALANLIAQQFADEAVEDAGGEKSAKRGPMTKEQKNKIGIIVPGQDLDDFLCTQSDVCVLRRDLKKLRRERLGNMKSTDPRFKAEMKQFRLDSLRQATQTFLTSEKLPECYLLGRKWYNEKIPEEGLQFFYDEPTQYETDQFANMILRTCDRWDLMYGFGVWREVALLIDIAYMSSSSWAKDLSFNVMVTGGHSSGKSYLFKSLGKTLVPGQFRAMNAQTAKSLNSGGPQDLYVNFNDELSSSQIGGDIDKHNTDFESILKSAMTDPVVRTKSMVVDKESRERVPEIYVSTHHGTWVGCYDGKLPEKSAALYNRWFPVPIDHIDTVDEDSIVNRMNQLRDVEVTPVVRESEHVERLKHFFVMLVNFYIYAGALDEPNMDAFNLYYGRYSKRMNELGYKLNDPKKYRQLWFAARTLTIRFAVHIALFSDLSYDARFDKATGKYINFFDKVEYFVPLIQSHLVCTRAVSVFAFSLCRNLWGSPVASRIVETMYRMKLSKNLDIFDDSCFASERTANSMRAERDVIAELRTSTRAAEDDLLDEWVTTDGAEVEAALFQEEHQRMLAELYLYDNLDELERAVEEDRKKNALAMAIGTPLQQHERAIPVTASLTTTDAPDGLSAALDSLSLREKARAAPPRKFDLNFDLESPFSGISDQTEHARSSNAPKLVPQALQENRGRSAMRESTVDLDDGSLMTSVSVNSDYNSRDGFERPVGGMQRGAAMFARPAAPPFVPLEAAPQRGNAAAGDANDAQKAAAISHVTSRVNFEHFYGDQGTEVLNANYIDLTVTETFRLVDVVLSIHRNSGTSKPSVENIDAAMKDMSSIDVAVPLLELNYFTKKIEGVKTRTGQPSVKRLPLLRISANTKKYDPTGIGGTGGHRVFILTQWLLQRKSLAAAIKESIRYLGFHFSIPGRMLTSLPKWISRYGYKDENAPRCRTHRVFDVVQIDNVPTEQFIVRNVEPITEALRESIAQTFRNADSAGRNFRPSIASQSTAILVEMEPEMTAALQYAESAGVPLQYAGSSSPFMLEFAILALRLKDCEGVGANKTYAYPRTLIESTVKQNRTVKLTGGDTSTAPSAKGSQRLMREIRKKNLLASGNDFSDTQRALAPSAVLALASISPDLAHAAVNDSEGNLRPFRNAAELEKMARVLKIDALHGKRKQAAASDVDNSAKKLARPTLIMGDHKSMMVHLYVQNDRAKRMREMNGERSVFDFVDVDPARHVEEAFHNASDAHDAIATASNVDLLPPKASVSRKLKRSAAPTLASSALLQRIDSVHHEMEGEIDDCFREDSRAELENDSATPVDIDESATATTRIGETGAQIVGTNERVQMAQSMAQQLLLPKRFNK